jgi:hypothetical protein
MPMQYRPLPRAHRAQADYSQWTIEELWHLAAQMRVARARSMSRRELIDLFAVSPKAAQH